MPERNEAEIMEARLGNINDLRRKIQTYTVESGDFELNDAIGEFAATLKSKYSDTDTYAAWHAFGGSTPIEGARMEHFDFPDEDSIEKFMENLAKRIPEKL